MRYDNFLVSGDIGCCFRISGVEDDIPYVVCLLGVVRLGVAIVTTLVALALSWDSAWNSGRSLGMDGISGKLRSDFRALSDCNRLEPLALNANLCFDLPSSDAC